MRCVRTVISMLVLTGVLANGVFAADSFILKEEAGNNYCHTKFAAISERTLLTNHPTPKSSSTADVVDYYGSCDESATSKDQVATQRLDELRDWRE